MVFKHSLDSLLLSKGNWTKTTKQRLDPSFFREIEKLGSNAIAAKLRASLFIHRVKPLN